MPHVEYCTAYSGTGRLRSLALRFGDSGTDKRGIDDIIDCGTESDRDGDAGVDDGSPDADPVGFDGTV